MVHVRFSPSGVVTDIGSRPETVTSQKWFEYLSGQAGEAYQPLSGGRGVFRIARHDLDLFTTALTAG